MNSNLIASQEILYGPLGLQIKDFAQEEESKDYSASRFTLGAKKVVFRTSKITPKKIGQFVTIWKRIGNGPIMPFDINDNVDLFIIQVQQGNKQGQFIFPKQLLLSKDLVSHNSKGGKRAMRVYTPWDKPTSNQAVKTQQWQQGYFFELSKYKIDLEKLKKLLL